MTKLLIYHHYILIIELDHYLLTEYINTRLKRITNTGIKRPKGKLGKLRNDSGVITGPNEL